MPVYNAELFLKESIESILNQSYRDFQFLILDDASSDGSLAIIKKYAQQDKRIIFFSNKKNRGAAFCRNFLMKKSSTEFFAWMDADDISFPHRLKTQIEFLQSNPDIDIVSGKAAFLGGSYTISHPLHDYQIKTRLFISGPSTVNPAAMLRKEKLKKYNIIYQENLRSAQDYQFWVDCAPYMKFANLNQVMIHYRCHPQQISAQKTQKKNHLTIMQKHFLKFSIVLEKDFLLALMRKKEINHSLLRQLDFFLSQIFAIHNFYDYRGVDKNFVFYVWYRDILRRAHWKLVFQGRKFFLKNFGWLFFTREIIRKIISTVYHWFKA